MFWAGIKNNEIIGPFKVPQGVKIDSKGYCQILSDFLIPWLDDRTLPERKSLVFQQDNAPAHKLLHTELVFGTRLQRRHFDGLASQQPRLKPNREFVGHH